MFGIQNYSNFIAAILMFQMIPGAGTVTILRASTRSGCSMGMRAVLGTLAGDLIYMLCAIFGLAAMLGACRNILAVAQWCGVAYLLMFHVTGISFLYQAGLVLVGNSLARHFSNWRFAGILANRLAGAGFIGFGIKLAISERFRAG
jgi:threonine/homoserine/homoserine lactone efflux protein